jgi:uncharacterized membrane protein
MRTAMKTASYGAMHFVVAIAVAYALTRDWQTAIAIGTVEPFVQTFAFAIHDRLWSRGDAKSSRAHGHTHRLGFSSAP